MTQTRNKIMENLSLFLLLLLLVLVPSFIFVILDLNRLRKELVIEIEKQRNIKITHKFLGTIQLKSTENDEVQQEFDIPITIHFHDGIYDIETQGMVNLKRIQ